MFGCTSPVDFAGSSVRSKDLVLISVVLVGGLIEECRKGRTKLSVRSIQLQSSEFFT
jgi:hypothetical protein